MVFPSSPTCASPSPGAASPACAMRQTRRATCWNICVRGCCHSSARLAAGVSATGTGAGQLCGLGVGISVGVGGICVAVGVAVGALVGLGFAGEGVAVGDGGPP